MNYCVCFNILQNAQELSLDWAVLKSVIVMNPFATKLLEYVTDLVFRTTVARTVKQVLSVETNCSCFGGDIKSFVVAINLSNNLAE